jgi:hypothetical protein
MKWFTSSIFSSILNLAMLAIAIVALIVAQRTLSESNRQFLENSIAADNLFKLQLRHSKDLNDSLVSQIKMLQSITNKQMQITDQQLAVSVQTYRAQLHAGRPIIAIRSSKISNTAVISSDSLSPLIQTEYSNVGKRHANDFIIRAFVVYSDFSDIRSSAGSPAQSFSIEPDVTMTEDFKPRILAKYQKNFYYCIDFRYTDEILKQKYYFAKYYHYFESRGVFDFYVCEDAEKFHIRETINNSIGRLRLQLFDK